MDDAPGADVQVPDLRVAHLTRRQADGSSEASSVPLG